MWDEFEQGATPEAKFARAIDKTQAFAQNVSSRGKTWREHHIAPERVESFNESWKNQNTAFSEIFNFLWGKAEKDNAFYK
ncbi:HD domain-containing protein [Paenibacillus sp. P25]|nr:HD domain-containing protein [Paenibacillus sp. P25]